MRDIYVVIDQIIDAIPKLDEGIDLRKRLAKIRESAMYRPPENSTLAWRELTVAIMEVVPKEPSNMNHWQLQVACLLGDVEIALMPRNAVVLKKGDLYIRRTDKGYVLDDKATPVNLKAIGPVLEHYGLGTVNSYDIIHLEM